MYGIFFIAMFDYRMVEFPLNRSIFHAGQVNFAGISSDFA
jgi:hypothetical protein